MELVLQEVPPALASAEACLCLLASKNCIRSDDLQHLDVKIPCTCLSFYPQASCPVLQVVLWDPSHLQVYGYYSMSLL